MGAGWTKWWTPDSHVGRFYIPDGMCVTEYLFVQLPPTNYEMHYSAPDNIPRLDGPTLEARFSDLAAKEMSRRLGEMLYKVEWGPIPEMPPMTRWERLESWLLGRKHRVLQAIHDWTERRGYCPGNGYD